MFWISTMATAAMITSANPSEDKARGFSFAKRDLGKVPAGWKATQTNKGEGSVWKVLADDSTPSKTGFALAQTAAGPKQVFNLCVADDTSLKDLEVSVHFK